MNENNTRRHKNDEDENSMDNTRMRGNPEVPIKIKSSLPLGDETGNVLTPNQQNVLKSNHTAKVI